MITLIPPLGILIDLPMGILMWSMIIHFLISIFTNENSQLTIMFIIRGINTPILLLTKTIRPDFVVERLAPIHAALILFMLRYYFFPFIIGFDVETFTEMPLEKLLISAKTDLGF